MGVIINEFEVVPEASAPEPKPASGGASGQTESLGPEDVVQMLKRQMERAARVRAD